MQQKQKTHRSLERALEIMLYFHQSNAEASIFELSQKYGLHKSTASRILTVLKNYGFLQQNPRNRKYSLGPTIARLGASLTGSFDSNLIQIARPHMEELRNAAGETTVLELPTPDHTVLAIVCEGIGPVRIKGVIGDHHPYHTSAGAKSILAFTNREHREAVLSLGLTAFTPHSKTDRGDLEKELEDIRRQGFAFDREENNLGIQAFGTPVFNHADEPVAAVVIAGAAQNVTWEQKDLFVPLIREVASRISAQLYFSDSAEPRTN